MKKTVRTQMEQSTPEIFQFGKLKFDIDKVRQHVASMDVSFREGMVNISNWAEKILLLDRSNPDRHPVSLWVGINYDHLSTVTPERCKDPIFAVETEFGWLIIDGNHRVARAYLDGINELPAVVFDAENTKKLMHNTANVPMKLL